MPYYPTHYSGFHLKLASLLEKIFFSSSDQPLERRVNEAGANPQTIEIMAHIAASVQKLRYDIEILGVENYPTEGISVVAPWHESFDDPFFSPFVLFTAPKDTVMYHAAQQGFFDKNYFLHLLRNEWNPKSGKGRAIKSVVGTFLETLAYSLPLQRIGRAMGALPVTRPEDVTLDDYVQAGAITVDEAGIISGVAGEDATLDDLKRILRSCGGTEKVSVKAVLEKMKSYYGSIVGPEIFQMVQAVHDGNTLVLYPAGGRTRDGGLKSLRTQILIQAYNGDAAKRPILPVYIGRDPIGRDAEKPRVIINIGRPYHPKDIEGDTMNSLRSCYVATFSDIFCYQVLALQDHNFSEEEVISGMRKTISQLKAGNIYVDESIPAGYIRSVRLALVELKREGYIKEHQGSYSPTEKLLSVPDADRSFKKNNKVRFYSNRLDWGSNGLLKVN